MTRLAQLLLPLLLAVPALGQGFGFGAPAQGSGGGGGLSTVETTGDGLSGDGSAGDPLALAAELELIIDHLAVSIEASVFRVDGPSDRELRFYSGAGQHLRFFGGDNAGGEGGAIYFTGGQGTGAEAGGEVNFAGGIAAGAGQGGNFQAAGGGGQQGGDVAIIGGFGGADGGGQARLAAGWANSDDGDGGSAYLMAAEADGTGTDGKVYLGLAQQVGGDVIWATLDASGLDLATALAATEGGTGLSTYTGAGRILYSSGATTLAALAPGSDGDVLTLASGVPSWAAPAAGGDLTITSHATGGTASSGSVIYTDDGTNNSNESNWTLSGSVGARRHFYCRYGDSDGANTDSLKVTAPTGETIRAGASVTGTAGNFATSQTGAFATFVKVTSTEWAAMGGVADWAGSAP